MARPVYSILENVPNNMLVKWNVPNVSAARRDDIWQLGMTLVRRRPFFLEGYRSLVTRRAATRRTGADKTPSLAPSRTAAPQDLQPDLHRLGPPRHLEVAR